MDDDDEKREDLNEQFGELIDLIDNEKDLKFSIKSFERKRSKFQSKWWIFFACIFIVLLSIILSNEQWSYNIYFIFLSFIRLILLQVSECDRRRRQSMEISSLLDSPLLGLDEILYKSMFHPQSIL